MSDTQILAALDAADAALDEADAALRTAHGAIHIARRIVTGVPPAPGGRYPRALTDMDIRPKPPLPTIGAAGSWFEDPTFGARIVRVTDGNTGNGASCRVASNAHLADWSADSAAFFVQADGVRVFRFDAATGAVSPAGQPYAQGEPCWSRTDPDALYAVGGPQTRTIRRWSLTNNTFTDVLDLDTLVPGLAEPRTYVGGIISGGGDSLVVFFGGQGQDSHYLITVLRPDTTPTVIDTQDLLGISLHSASIDLSGRYVMLYATSKDIEAGKPKQIVWDTTKPIDAAFTSITVCPWGHDSLGFGLQVNQDTSGLQPYDGRQWQLRALSAVHDTHDLIDPQPTPPETYISDHTSWNSDRPDDPQPVLSALYRDDNPSRPVAPWGTWDDEIVAIATDGSGTVYRFAHHRSNVRSESNPEKTDFWSQPMPNVSPDGNHLLFTSNMERTLGRDAAGALRQDVFIVALR